MFRHSRKKECENADCCICGAELSKIVDANYSVSLTFSEGRICRKCAEKLQQYADEQLI